MGKAMKRRSKAGGKAVKAGRHKTTPKRFSPAKAVPLPSSSTASNETIVARLTRERDEALEWQSATSDILRAITAMPSDADGTLRKIAETTARLFGAVGVSFRIAEGDEFKLSVGVGQGVEQINAELYDDPAKRPTVGGRNLPGTVVRLNQQIHVPDLDDLDAEKADWPGLKVARASGIRTIVGTPLRMKGRAIGALTVNRNALRPFEAVELKLLQTFADQAVIAIENTRLLNELRQSLEQQTATADVLRIISSSPNDLGPVFQSMLENAVRICEANFGTLSLYEGDAFRMVAVHNVPRAFEELRRRQPLFRPRLMLRMAETKQVLHIADVAQYAASESVDPDTSAFAKLSEVRTTIGVPMLKDGNLVGAIVIYRKEVKEFTDRHIELIKHFAGQAVIAIENARLLKELRERTEEVEKLNQYLEQRVADQVGEIERMSKLRRFLPPQVADLIVASGSEKQLESHRREITALFCDLRGFTGFSESSDPEDVMALLRDYHAAIGQIVIKYNGTLERYAGDGVMVIFNDPMPVENPALRAVLMALEVRDAIGSLTETWRRWGHEIGFGIGIAHGFATLGTIGFEGRFDYAAIGTVSNVASRLCDEAKPGQILISPRVLTQVEEAVKVEPVGEFELKGIRRPLAAYNVLSAIA